MGCGGRSIIVFPGSIKPWKLAELGADSFVSRNYRRSTDGRCLILGYGSSLWSDVERLDLDRFDAVIASPEAARRWPRTPLAVAIDNDHAVRLATMHGFDDITFAGRSEGIPL